MWSAELLVFSTKFRYYDAVKYYVRKSFFEFPVLKPSYFAMSTLNYLTPFFEICLFGAFIVTAGETFDRDCFACCQDLFIETQFQLSDTLKREKGSDVQELEDYCKLGCTAQSESGCNFDGFFASVDAQWCRYGYELFHSKLVTVSDKAVYKCVRGSLEEVKSNSGSTFAPSTLIQRTDFSAGIIAFALGTGILFFAAAFVIAVLSGQVKRRDFVDKMNGGRYKSEEITVRTPLEDEEEPSDKPSDKPWSSAENRANWLKQVQYIEKASATNDEEREFASKSSGIASFPAYSLQKNIHEEI